MPLTCCMMGTCFYCMDPKGCHERYGRPLDQNDKFTRIYMRITGEDYSELKRVIEERAVEEPKPEEKRVGFIRAMSIWTYWKLIQLGLAVVKALKMMRKK